MIEFLETRRLLSTINWVNRVTSDGFAIYGANTAIARAICDRAIDDWERVIENFNYQGGGNTYSLTLNAAAIGGRGQTANIAHLAGKPISATVTIDDNAQGGGWYFDPTPGTALVPDDGEYQTSFPYEFAANNPITDNDYYRTVAHEIGHAVGLSFTTGLLINTFTTDTGVDDPNSTGTSTLRVVNFNGGPSEFTLTEMGGCHMYEGPAIPGMGITAIHPNDMMNDGRTVGLNINRRQLISDSLTSLFQQAYGYTVTMPSQINTFYVNLNTTTDVITINGDINGNANDVDTILIEDLGSATRFTVNGAVETIDNVEYSSVVINAGQLNDAITIAGLPAGKTVTVNGGSGATDTLTFDDQANSADTAYTLTSTTLTRTGLEPITISGIETLNLSAGSGADTIDINSTFLGAIFVNGNGGTDTINLVDHAVGAVITLDAGAGLDVMNINSDGAGSATAQIAVTQDLAALNILAGGFMKMVSDGSLVIETRALSIAPTGTLDLANNDLILDYETTSQLNAIQTLINMGRAGGAWTGFGITSTNAREANPANTTLGAMEASDFKTIYGNKALFGNRTIDTTAVLVKYTYYGDADFNGEVNFDDYARADAGFNSGATGWVNGDFDGNGTVNFDDYSLMDLAFNTQGGPLRSVSGVASSAIAPRERMGSR